MSAILSRLAGLVLIILGVGFFPFAVMGFLYTVAGRTPVGLVMVAVDALLLFAGAAGVVGLWRRRSN